MLLTTKYIWTDVSGTASLILQKVLLADQVFSEAEVCESYSSRPLVKYHVTQLEITMYNVFLRKKVIISTDNFAHFEGEEFSMFFLRYIATLRPGHANVSELGHHFFGNRNFLNRKCIETCCMEDVKHFGQASIC